MGISYHICQYTHIHDRGGEMNILLCRRVFPCAQAPNKVGQFIPCLKPKGFPWPRFCNCSGHLATCGGSPLVCEEGGCGRSHPPHTKACEQPKAVRSQKRVPE